MTASERSNSPDFFESNDLDPFSTATGGPVAKKSIPKKKAGFYLSEPLLERFNRRYHQLKLAGQPVENKSALLEAALEFALDDMDKEKNSHVLKKLEKKQ